MTSLPPKTLKEGEKPPEDESEDERKQRERDATDSNNEGANKKVYLSVIMSLMWLCH